MDEKSIFNTARKIADDQDRDEYLRLACKDDVEALKRIRDLLAEHDEDSDFLESPPVAADRTHNISESTELIGTEIGPYKLLQEIGEGGMGTVYMAEQERPIRRQVALKIIKPGMDSKQVVARFESERQALSMMSHPNIAQVLDVGMTEQGRPFFAMELIEGLPITKYCDGNNLTIADRLQLFQSVCDAVQHAHQKGIIHRDLKPSNILVAEHDGKPVPKVIDFGLAKALDQQLTEKTLFTHLGQIVGTLEYMSPEQSKMNQSEVDTRTDIYSLGVLLYELLTGTIPFDENHFKTAALDRVLKIIREDDPPKPSLRMSTAESSAEAASHRGVESKQLGPLLQGDLDWIVMKALEKDRERRYQTAEGFGTDIERYLQGEAVIAAPPSASYRMKKFVRRNLGIVLSGSLVLATLLIGILGTSVGLIWARQKMEIARTAEKTAEQEAGKVRAAEGEAIVRQKETEFELARTIFFSVVQRIQSNRLVEASLLLDKISEEYRKFEWHLARRQLRPTNFTCYGHTDHIRSVRFSPDGKRIVSGSQDNTIKIWDAATGKELVSLEGHMSLGWLKSQNGRYFEHTGVYCVRYSPDGTWIASASGDGTVKIWDAATGKELLNLEGHTDQVKSLSISPDGKRIASGSHDKTIKIWETTTGRLLRTLTGSTGRIFSLCFSPDGKTIASGTGEGELKILDAANGNTLFKRQVRTILHVSFSPGGTRIACSGTGSHIWDVATGKEILDAKSDHVDLRFSPDERWIATARSNNERDRSVLSIRDAFSGEEIGLLHGHNSGIASMSFSPDGRRIASASTDCTIKVWDVPTFNKRRIKRGQDLSSVSYSPDGARIAALNVDGKVSIWDVPTGRQLVSLNQEDNERILYPYGSLLSFSPDGTRITTGVTGPTHMIKVWDAATGQVLVKLEGHTDRITGLGFSPNGTWIASASWDGTIKTWDAATGKKLLDKKVDNGFSHGLSISPDGTRIASTSLDTIKVWEAATGEELLSLKGYTGSVLAVVFSPDGARIASGGQDPTIKIWDAVTGDELAQLKGHTDNIVDLSFSPDGKRIVSGCHDKSIKVWDAATGKELSSLAEFARVITDVCFSPDGKQIAFGRGRTNMETTIRIWEPAKGREIRTIGTSTGHNTALSFSPNSALVASGSRDGSINIWDANTKRILRTLEGHSDVISSLSFSRDSSQIISGSHDATVKLWDVPSGEELRTFAGHTSFVTSVDLSPDGTRIASGCYDKTIKIWETTTGRLLRTLTGSTGWVTSVSFSPDGQQIVSGSGHISRSRSPFQDKNFSPAWEDLGRTIKIWDVTSGRLLKTLTGHKGPVDTVKFSPDGRRIASGSMDKLINIWDATTGKVLSRLSGHQRRILELNFSPDGTRIASSGLFEIKIWDTTTGQELQALKGDSNPFAGVSFSGDGTKFVTSGSGRMIRIWNGSQLEQEARIFGR